MPQLLKNNVSGVLGLELSAVATTMTLISAADFPAPTGGDHYLVTLFGLNANGQEDKWEIVRVTAKASNTLTITRAQEGTTARLWPYGTTVQMRLTAASVFEIASGGTGQTTKTAAFDALSPSTTLGDMIYSDGTNNVRLAGNSAASRRFLTQTGTGAVSAAPGWNAILDGDVPSALTGKTYNGLSLTANATGFQLAGGTTSKTLVVSNNLTLSGTDGSTLNIGSGGTLGSAAYTASSAYEPAFATLAASKGGTGINSYAVGDLLYASGTTSLSKLASVAVGSVLLAGGVGSAPSWGKVALESMVQGVLGGSNGGTNNAFTSFTGPATTVKTFTLPNADATILTTNAAVTVAQGGTGATDAATARTNLGLAIGSNVQAWDADLDAIAALAGTSGFLKKTAANTWSLDTNTYLTGNQSISISGDASGSGTTSISLTLANSGVSANTYGGNNSIPSITVDAKGRVTSASAVTPSGTWGISISGNAATATTLQTARTIDGIGFNGSQNIKTTEWFHSGRDFANGTIVTTDVNYAVSAGDPWILEIRGNSYGEAVPFDIQVQGYIYSDTIINYGGYSNGTGISGLVALNVGGNLVFWFPRQAYWHGYNVRVYAANATYATNRVSSITEGAKPSGTKEVALSSSIRQSLHSSNYTSYSPSLTGSGASGTWSINVTGNAGSASSVAWTNVSGRPTAVSSFTNDSGYITSGGRAYPRRSDGGDLNFYWSGQSGQPTWLWGGNDGTNMYVYNPSNFSVSYASSAGTASSCSGNAATAYGLSVHAGRNNEANKVVRTDGNGYLQVGYINSSSGNENNASNPPRVWGTNGSDDYLRTYQTSSLSVGYASSAGGVAWTNVSGRPTAVSSFSNDSGYVTSSGSVAYATNAGGISTSGPLLGYSYSAVDTSYGGQAGPQIQGQGGGGAVFSLHRPGSYAINLGLDSDNVFRIGGWSASSNRLQMDMSGNLTMAGNVTAYSDERLKKDWAELPADFIERLAEVKHGTYTRIDDGMRQVGVSAQSLRDLLPEAVLEGEYLSVAYGNAALAACVELARELAVLRAEVAALRGANQ